MHKMMNEKLQKHLTDLDNEGDELISTGKNLLENFGMSEFTLFCTAILNRTINLNRGFVTLVKDSNYIAAAPLVRLNLDSLLRLFASTQSEYDYETFAQKVRNGDRINQMKDKKGKNQLRDSELVKRLKKIKGFKWTEDIYDIGSGFVHLSNKHVISSYRIEDTVMSGGIRKNDEFISIDEKIAATHYMTQSSKGIRIFIGGWMENINKARLPNPKK